MNNIRDKDTDYFLGKYGATAQLSRQSCYRPRPLQYQGWIHRGDPTVQYWIDVEPMVEMHIPQHCLELLVKRDNMVQDLIRGQEGLKLLLEQRNEDQRIRRENPSVQAAYEKYQILLEMARK